MQRRPPIKPKVSLSKKQAKAQRKLRNKQEAAGLQRVYASLAGDGADVGKVKQMAFLRGLQDERMKRNKSLARVITVCTAVMLLMWLWNVWRTDIAAVFRLVATAASVPLIGTTMIVVGYATRELRKDQRGKFYVVSPLVGWPPARLFYSMLSLHMTWLLTQRLADKFVGDELQQRAGLELVVLYSVPAASASLLSMLFLVLMPAKLAQSGFRGLDELHLLGAYSVVVVLVSVLVTFSRASVMALGQGLQTNAAL